MVKSLLWPKSNIRKRMSHEGRVVFEKAESQKDVATLLAPDVALVEGARVVSAPVLVEGTSGLAGKRGRECAPASPPYHPLQLNA